MGVERFLPRWAVACQPQVYFGHNLYLLCSEKTSCHCGRASVTTSKCFINVQNIMWRAQTIYKDSMQVKNLNAVCKINVAVFGIFLTYPFNSPCGVFNSYTGGYSVATKPCTAVGESCALYTSASLLWTFSLSVIYGNILRVTGALCGEFTGYRLIPLKKASDAELWCFLWSAPEQRVK